MTAPQPLLLPTCRLALADLASEALMGAGCIRSLPGAQDYGKFPGL